MRVVLIGASGMVGQGVLRACLKARDVTEIIVIGRRTLLDYEDPRLRVFIVPDLNAFEAVDAVFANVDACFFCVGVTSFGMSEAAYRAVTYDLTLHVAQQLLTRSPRMTMVYVSGAGADSSEQGKTMWARIRGQTENALQRLAFGQVAIFRPSAIIPEDGIQSRTASYRWMYIVLKPLLQLARRISPASVLTTRIIGDAMLNVVRHGVPRAILKPADIYRLGIAQT
ncbi:NAD-dependent epimerase/dehydratase family protein [Paraburkholderia silviterrae]|uniref:NAD-dependent epimerase/dehydratase family protein n=1 Tax=Paraburkholderia silviterrae TaxID=2528715 RepID=A0A4R5LXR8_9BURK|nr:NAD-dependent epimerase/dehydratase family protein [Paraburkholderia silviterrae]TDG16553.1 NAD-dependent epimerase/dehydratase family protein [Paraburkholderia silviterrae]